MPRLNCWFIRATWSPQFRGVVCRSWANARSTTYGAFPGTSDRSWDSGIFCCAYLASHQAAWSLNAFKLVRTETNNVHYKTYLDSYLIELDRCNKKLRMTFGNGSSLTIVPLPSFLLYRT